MRVLITGGGGFLGSRLADALLARDAAASTTLLDVAFPNATDPRFHAISGDLTSPQTLGRALPKDIDSIFHLAAVVSGGAEADFDLATASTWTEPVRCWRHAEH